MSTSFRPCRALRIADEFEQIAVRIADVPAGASDAPAGAPPRPIDRPQFHLGTDPLEQHRERVSTTLPYDTEVAARWFRGRCARGEPAVLPKLGTVEVELLIAQVNRADLRPFVNR